MRFDRDYYRRFYYNPRTAVTTKREMTARAHLIAAFVEHTGLPVRRILDAGCGTGLCAAGAVARLPPTAISPASMHDTQQYKEKIDGSSNC